MIIAGFLVWCAGLLVYFYDLRRGFYRLHPVRTYVLMAIGAGLLVFGLVLSRSGWGWAALGGVILLTALFLYWMLMYSVTPGGLVVKVGEPMPDFEVADSTGGIFRPQDLAGRCAALFVFYRGAW